MTYYPGSDSANLRFEEIDSVIRGIMEQNFIMKNLVDTVQVSEWKSSYFRESIKTFANLVSNSQNRTPQGVPRMTDFPEDEVLFEKITARQLKFAAAATISLEDSLSSVIDNEMRHSARIANRIVGLIDTHVWNTLAQVSAAGVPTATDIYGINTYSPWSNPYLPSRRPAEDLLVAKATIGNSALQSYRANTAVINPLDGAYVASADSVVTGFSQSGSNLVKTGQVGELSGLAIVESPTVTADYALVLQSKVCGTFQQLKDLETAVVPNPLISKKIRAALEGVCQLKAPRAVCLISNTR